MSKMLRLATILLLGLNGVAQANAADIDATKSAQLERLVIQDCGSCHGLTLKGGLGRPITPDLMRDYDRDVLRDIILDGIPGTAMPPWRPLMSERDALWIADYLRGAEK